MGRQYMAKSAGDRDKDRNRARQGGGGEFAERLDALGDRLKTAKRQPERDDEAARRRGSAMGVAFRLAADLIAGVLVGGFIGWQLDEWLGTRPILLLIFLILGAAAGVLNVVRSARRMQQDATDADRGPKPPGQQSGGE